MSHRDLRVPGGPDQHAQSQGGLQLPGHIPQETQGRARKSSLITVKTGQRKTSFVSFDEITTTIETEETTEDKEKEIVDTVDNEEKCEDEGELK